MTKGRPPKDKQSVDLKSSSEADFSAYLSSLESDKTCLTVTEKRPGQDNRRWNVDVNCLLCAKLIEKAAEDVPPEAPVDGEDLVDTTTKPPAEVEDEVDSVIDNNEPVEPNDDNAADAEHTAAPVTNGETTAEPSPA